MRVTRLRSPQQATVARPENTRYAALVKARATRECEWPEPETSELYAALLRGAIGIGIQVLGRREPELGAEIATRTLLNLHKFRKRSQFSTWFYKLARNCIANYLRDGDPAVALDKIPEPEVPPIEPTFDLPEGLSLTDKQIVRLVVAGYSFREIAQFLGVSLGQAYKQWEFIRKKLVEIYKHD